MKKIIFTFVFSIISVFQFTAQELSPYIKVGVSTDNINVISEKISSLLTANDFEVLGEYSPEDNQHLKVISFTNKVLKNTVVNIKDRGALAATMKIGLQTKNGKTTISYTNPPYFLRAYSNNYYSTYESVFNQFTTDLKNTLTPLGNEFAPFGGSVKTKKLKDYHYKILMPYFTDYVTLNTYGSFEEGLKVITSNLTASNTDATLVHKIVYANKKVAVFGIALTNKNNGEGHFLPIIGEENIAAMPYQIILQNNTATMLHGKYRLALHWPELSMGTFMKIMGTPGDIEDHLEKVCKPLLVQ